MLLSMKLLKCPVSTAASCRGSVSPKGGDRGGAGRQPLGGAGEGLQPSYRVRRDVLQARVLPLHRRQEVRLEQTGGGVIPIPGTPPGGGTCPLSPEAPEWPVVHPWGGKGQIDVAVAHGWTRGAVMGLLIHRRDCRLGSHSPKAPCPQARATSSLWALTAVRGYNDGPRSE